MRAVARWFRYRAALAWWVLRHDSTAFAEALSGLALVGLRGLLLLGVHPANPPYDVTRLLADAGVTEGRWSVFLMLCGLLQVMLAGSRHYRARIYLKMGIVLAFAIVVAAYWLVDEWDRPVVLSLMCILAFYFGLLVRVLADHRAGVLSLEERHARTAQ